MTVILAESIWRRRGETCLSNRAGSEFDGGEMGYAHLPLGREGDAFCYGLSSQSGCARRETSLPLINRGLRPMDCTGPLNMKWNGEEDSLHPTGLSRRTWMVICRL